MFLQLIDTCDLDEGMYDVRSLREVRRGSGRAGTARATAGENGNHWTA